MSTPSITPTFDSILGSALSAPSPASTPAGTMPLIETKVEQVLPLQTEQAPPPAAPASEAEPVEPEIPPELAEIIAEADEESKSEEEKPEAEPEPEPEPDKEGPEKPAEEKTPNMLDLKSSRGKRIYAGYKGWRDLTNTLGYEPSIDELKEFHRTHTERMAMEHEFTSADPRAAVNWAQNWNKTSPQGMATVAAVLPDVLASMNSEAYVHMAVPVLNRFANALYERAQTELNAETKARIVDAARIVESQISGRWRTDEELNKPVDPLAAREQAIAEQMKQIQTFQQQQAEDRWGGFVRDTDSAIDKAVDEEVAKGLEPLAKAFKDSPKAFQALRNDYRAQVIDLAQKAEGAFRTFQIRYEQARRTMAETDRAEIVRQFRGMVTRSVAATRANFIRDAAGSLVKANQAQRANLQQAATKAAPAASNAPAQRSMTSPMTKGKSADALIDELLGVR